jgi:hypothetical protein
VLVVGLFLVLFSTLAMVVLVASNIGSRLLRTLLSSEQVLR